MLAIFEWVMAGTAMWHFAVHLPDHFYPLREGAAQAR